MFEVLVGGGSSSDDGVSPAFGHPMRSEFGFDEDWVNLNQGSFGAVPLKILDKLHSFEQLAEQRVEIWFNFIEGYHGYLLQSRAAIAIYVSANESDIVMVENGSGGMNSVLRSQIFSPGDRILVLDSAYPMVKKILDYLTEVEGIEVLVVPPFTYPLNSTTQIVDAVRSFIEANIASPIKFAIFSHVEAAPSTVLPVTELVAMAHSYGITVAVDGSQAMGNIDINITAIDPDYYVATAYKWFFAPKGTGFLYARNSLQTKSNPMPPIISEYVNAFPDRFSYTGTRDYCPFSTMVDVFTWRDYVGGDKAIKDYNINLAWAAAEFLSSTWGTVISGPPEVASAMADVKFPEDDWELANWVHDTLLSRYNKVMYIYQLPDGTIWTRISASIYLELSDFETLSYQVNNLIAEYRASSVH
ncbi:aminotransferase family protein [Pelomyxa schiedti]|nr:aminotransferase family protein [Pelomyxa schiedti]